MKIYKISTKFPLEERYSLTSQIRNSANSVIANIAEAHGRYYYADKVRVLYQVRGEVEETQSHLAVALGLGHITSKVFNELDSEYNGLAKGISSYIYSFKKKNTD